MEMLTYLENEGWRDFYIDLAIEPINYGLCLDIKDDKHLSYMRSWVVLFLVFEGYTGAVWQT